MKTIIIILCFVSIQSFAKNVMFTFGGVGDKPGEWTIFDGHLYPLYQFKQKTDWETDYLFDGDHTKTTDYIKQYLNPSNQPFTPKNFQNKINDIIFKIQAGEIKEGDQLFLSHLGHGGNQDLYKTHFVQAIPDPVENEKDPAINFVTLDALMPLFELASAHKIKLAFLDSSCWSGMSQYLAKAYPGTCVISSTSSNNLSYSEFIKNFYQRMEKGKNLEEVFLEARKATLMPALPMISSGKMANEMVNYFEHFSWNTGVGEHGYDMFYVVLLKHILNNPGPQSTPQCPILDLNPYFEELETLAWMINALSNVDIGSLANEIQDIMTESNLLSSNIVALYGEIDKEGAETFNITIAENENGNETFPIDVSSLVNSNYERELHDYQALLINCERQKNCQNVAKHIKIIELLMQKKEEIKETNSFKKTTELKKVLDEKKAKTVELSQKFIEKERALYEELFRSDLIKRNTNPCRDFVL